MADTGQNESGSDYGSDVLYLIYGTQVSEMQLSRSSVLVKKRSKFLHLPLGIIFRLKFAWCLHLLLCITLSKIIH